MVTSPTTIAVTQTTMAVALLSLVAAFWLGRSTTMVFKRKKKKQERATAYESMIGSTPCIELKSLSRLCGRRIMCKMESCNPGGTGKDRAALRIIQEAERQGLLPPPLRENSDNHPQKCDATIHNTSTNDDDDWSLIQSALVHSRTGGLVIEGTSGSTGIALATLSRLHGHACLVVVPDDQAIEKQTTLRTLGATVRVVRTVSIANPHHYVNVARRLTDTAQKHGVLAVWGDQFETACNAAVHYETTGPEIWQQCRPDAFCMSAGTGGTVAGVAHYLKEKSRRHTRVVLVDPVGSVLAAKVTHGVAFTSQQQERSLRRHRYDSIAEGIGLDRVTANFTRGLPYIDEAYTISDQDAIDMAHWILGQEGLLVGCSTAMNLVGAVRTAMKLPPTGVVCTLVCDAGHRHMTRFWNREFLEDNGLHWPVSPFELPGCISSELSQPGFPSNDLVENTSSANAV